MRNFRHVLDFKLIGNGFFNNNFFSRITEKSDVIDVNRISKIHGGEYNVKVVEKEAKGFGCLVFGP